MRSLAGTQVRVSPEGDIYYSVWIERSYILKPELYAPCCRLPQGWNLKRTLTASSNRPISEIRFLRIRKDGGSVEAAIRAMDHVLTAYRDRGQELEQVNRIETQIERAMTVLQEMEQVPREQFEEGFGQLHRETMALLEKCGMSRATLAIKKNIAQLLDEASTGKDVLGRRNAIAALKKLQAAARRVAYRWAETKFIEAKFSTMREGLVRQREEEREILAGVQHEMTTGLANHAVFSGSERRTTPLQRGVIIGKIRTLIYRLEKSKVKRYKTMAHGLIKQLEVAREAVWENNYLRAKVIFEEVSQTVVQVQEEFT